MSNNIPYSPEQYNDLTPMSKRLRITDLSVRLTGASMQYIPEDRPEFTNSRPAFSAPISEGVKLDTEATAPNSSNKDLEADAQRKIDAIFN